MPLKFSELERNTAQRFIKQLHNSYLARINDYYQVGEEQLPSFSWAGQNKVTIFCIKVYDDQFDNKANIIFACASKIFRNKVLCADAYDLTNNPSFSNAIGSSQQLEWFVEKKLLNRKLVNHIIPSSIDYVFGDLEDASRSFCRRIANDWVDDEYKQARNVGSSLAPLTPVSFSKQRYFVDRYHFADILKTINDMQFTEEFNQCLWAYDNQKWFLCASGLGSCIEHLMLMILQNYAKSGYLTLKGLGFSPMFSDYIKKFKKPPLNISSRQETYFRMIFMARNAIDHFNTGNTSKELCDIMLTGLFDIFNDYFGKSLNKK